MKVDFNYCVVVCNQHNYTDNAKEAFDWLRAATQAWIDTGKKGPKPELLRSRIGSNEWGNGNA